MKKQNPISTSTDDLQNRSEALLPKNPTEDDEPSRENLQNLIEDLKLYQVELEMQNENLRRAYQELDQVKNNYLDLYDFAPIGYMTLDSNNRIVEINLAGAKMLGLERHCLVGSHFSRFVLSDSTDCFYQHHRQCFEARQRNHCELRMKGADENPRYFYLESGVVSDEKGNLSRIRTAMIDITERKKAEERIKSLNHELLKSQEDERQMISRELHDRIAQELSAAKMGYDALMCDLPDTLVEVRERAAALSKILQHGIITVRDLSYELRPPGLEGGNIVDSLFYFCSEFSERSGIRVEFHSTGMENTKIDSFTAINIYRQVQEGLFNVRKHAEAERVRVTCSYIGSEIVICIMDNGKGFDVAQRMADLTAEKRMGLRSMEERANLMGGVMRVWSKPMEGTRIFIRIPYEQKTS